MKIYGFPVSPFVRKVMVVAAEKGIASEIVPANPMQPDEEFLAASPYRKIPAIDDGGFKLADSSAIATYIEAKHPEPALLPADPEARARAVWFDEVADTVVMPAGAPMMINRFLKPRIFGQEGDEAAALDSEEAVTQKLAYLEETLGEAGWLDGEFSLGDISVACVLRSFAYAGWELDAGKFPKVAAWYGRVQERDGWKKAAEVEDRIVANAGF